MYADFKTSHVKVYPEKADTEAPAPEEFQNTSC